jgi:hypothetical protein
MYRKLAGLLLVGAMLAPMYVWAVTEEDFKVKTTRNLLNLCTVPAEDPQYKEAIHTSTSGNFETPPCTDTAAKASRAKATYQPSGGSVRGRTSEIQPTQIAEAIQHSSSNRRP